MEDTQTTITILQIVITALTAIIASSGFWAFINRKRDNTTYTRKLLIGLAHDRIVTLCLKYIRRGCVTQEEHENLITFLANPYLKMGGNGSVLRLIELVNKLPIDPNNLEGELNNVK